MAVRGPTTVMSYGSMVAMLSDNPWYGSEDFRRSGTSYWSGSLGSPIGMVFLGTVVRVSEV